MWFGRLAAVYGGGLFFAWREVCVEGSCGFLSLWDFFVGTGGDFGG